jgi:hypothetical protein
MLMPVLLKFTIPITALVALHKLLTHKIVNYLKRPKLSLNLKRERIVFTKNDGSADGYEYTVLYLKNHTNKHLNINLHSMMLNNERYAWTDKKLSHLMHDSLSPNVNRDYISCTNEVLMAFNLKWRELSGEAGVNIVLEPFSAKSFPLSITKKTPKGFWSLSAVLEYCSQAKSFAFQ